MYDVMMKNYGEINLRRIIFKQTQYHNIVGWRATGCVILITFLCEDVNTESVCPHKYCIHVLSSLENSAMGDELK